MTVNDVRSLFDSQAGRWADHYAAGADMSGRPALFADALAARSSRPATILDFGCGAGDVSLSLAAQGWRVTGIDLSSQMIATARARSSEIDWRVAEPDTALPFGEQTFDACVASSVLEYVDRPTSTIRDIARLVRPGGWLLATVPDMRHPLRRRERRRALLARLPMVPRFIRGTRWEYGLGYLRLSKNRPDVERWRKWFGEGGFELEAIPPCQSPLLLLCGRRTA